MLLRRTLRNTNQHSGHICGCLCVNFKTGRHRTAALKRARPREGVCFLTLDIHMDIDQPLALAPSFKGAGVAAPGGATYLCSTC